MHICYVYIYIYIYIYIPIYIYIYVVVITRCRVQYGKHFPTFSYLLVKYEKRGKFSPNCLRQRAITTLSLNAC